MAQESNPSATVDLLALFTQGRYADAEAGARRLIEQAPQDPFAWTLLGVSLQAMRRPEEAIAALKEAQTFAPGDAQILNTLGAALEETGQLAVAGVCYAQAARQEPGFVAAFYNLARLLERLGQFEEARFYYEHTLSLDPDHLKSLNQLGNLLRALKQNAAALKCYQRALNLNANQPELLSNLGNLLVELGQLEHALACQHQAAALRPHDPEILCNLGTALHEMGQIDESLAAYEEAIRLRPTDSAIRSRQLFTLNYHPDLSPEEIFGAYQAFEQRFGLPHRDTCPPHLNDPRVDRRLRIGYVSADFRSHSTSHFLEPLLAHHDHEQFEIFAYVQNVSFDHLSLRYRKLVDHWVPIAALDDAAVVARIRADQIDILVDLAGHTAGNRLGIFARRPAPVSLTWLGYGYTTGLSAVDYFLTDPVLTPPGCEPLFSERLWRLERPFIAYRPNPAMGDPGPLPAITKGLVTFATLSRGVRVNHRVIRVWSAILKRVPGSQLVLDSKSFQSPAIQEQWAARFTAHGIARERLVMGCHSPPWDLLRDIDISLDCFPHNSGTTLVESLYMGIPVVTLAERPSVGRIGSAILTALGHPEWIAQTEEEYIEKAVELATDLDRLAAIRASLRAELEASPLRDEVGFTQAMERAYRQMWQQWCAGQVQSSRLH
ncbi:tetratricopeptide repeat protein [Caldichromatium japonicum]|uniref:protein O-GlcNAc transferase n=1 Tax=Caldichromatium japonicum TaxID=2699430 RepID=A0A6G7VEI9_9GAMM|nr:tetratricopeptide repeat protein [Caldichromatium japonicum]QIK38493.1 tetratricopeptide repeat protein [Caldichromatium japonicum]